MARKEDMLKRTLRRTGVSQSGFPPIINKVNMKAKNVNKKTIGWGKIGHNLQGILPTNINTKKIPSLEAKKKGTIQIYKQAKTDCKILMSNQ